MTNSEVIKKICKHAGINEAENQLFFDSFTKRIFMEFKTGDMLKVGNIGFLHLKNIRTSESGVQIKGIVFSETSKASRGDNVFYISNDADIFRPSDFCFSPSLRKMEIPLGDEIDTRLFVPPSGNELLSFIDSKVENLFNKSEIIRDNLNDEVFVIPIEIHGMKVIENLEDISAFKSVLEEEGKKIDPGKFQKIDSITSGLKEDAADKFIQNKLFKNKPIIVVKEGKDDSKVDDESGYDKVRYNRINSLTNSEKQKTEDKKEDLQPIPGMPSVPEGDKKEVPADQDKESADIETGIKELSAVIELDKKEKGAEQKNYVRQKEVKRRSKGKFFIPLAVIIIIGFSIYFLRLYNFKGLGNSEEMKTLPASNPVEIARNYDIPVDYPYQPNNQGSLLFDGIDSSVYKGIKENNEISQNTTDEGDIPTVKQGAYKELGQYIYTDGKIYFVQVSSWKYKSSAINHMERLKKEGYNASVERVISSSGDIYFRVRLGNFNSLEEAKKYVQNN